MRVDVRAKMSLLDGDTDGSRERLGPLALRVDESVARGTGLIIELDGSGGEETAAGKRLLIHPVEPAGEERPHARLAAVGAERRREDGFAAARGGELEDIELPPL